MQASALGIGSPTAANVTTAWTGDALVQSAFQSTAGVQGLAGLAAADTSGTVTSALNYQSELTFTLNASQLTSQDLLVGWLNPTITGAGLTGSDYVTMEIDRQSVPFTEMTFTSNAAMLAYFSDNVLNLGAENAGLSGGSLNLEFKFDFSSSAAGAGFTTDLVFGNAIPTPEPSSSVLLALGVCGLLSRAAVLRLRRRSS
jgi:hypothetical protein